MFNDERDVHYTVASRISEDEGGGWEFYCQSCGYHARYIVGKNNAFRKLEILEIGNPFVRHSSDAFDLFDSKDGEIPDSMSEQPPGFFDNSSPEPSSSPYTFDTTPDEDRFNPFEQPIEVDESWITPEIEEYFNQLLEKLDV